MQAGLTGGRGAAVTAGAWPAPTVMQMAGPRGASAGGGLPPPSGSPQTVAPLRRAYVAVAGRLYDLDARVAPPGTLVSAYFDTGIAAAVFARRPVSPPASPYYPRMYGVVVEEPLTRTRESPVAILGAVRALTSDTIGRGEWVSEGSVDGEVRSMHRYTLHTPVRPEAALGYALSDSELGFVDIFLLGLAQSSEPGARAYQWALEADFLGSVDLVNTAGVVAFFASEGRTWGYFSQAGTPASDLYTGRGSAVRIITDSTPTIPDLWLVRPKTTPTAALGELVNLGSLDPLFDLEVRWAQAGTGAQTRRLGLTSARFGTAGEPANGVYVRHTNAGNIIAVCRAAAAETTVDTGVATAAGEYHHARLFTGKVSDPVTIEIDGERLATTIASAALPSVMLGIGAGGSSSTAAQGLDVDLLAIRSPRGYP